MGRHTKLAEEMAARDLSAGKMSAGAPPVTAAYPEPLPPARSAHRMAWIGRAPLLPVLSGLGAVGVVVAAFSTQQISLNFAGGAPGAAKACSSADCDGAAKDTVVREKKDRASRAAGRTPVSVAFKPVKLTKGGFIAVAVITNTSGKAVPVWRLGFKIPNAAVLSAAGVTVKAGGALGSAAYFKGSRVLAAGQEIKVPFTAKGAFAKPSVCRFNQGDCT